MNQTHPAVQTSMDLVAIFGEATLEAALALHRSLRRRRRGYTCRHPGPHTPLWNRCIVTLRRELKPYGSRARLARYLGIPRQRVTDFVTGRRRMPDAELTLALMCWLSAKKAGRDLSR